MMIYGQLNNDDMKSDKVKSQRLCDIKSAHYMIQRRVATYFIHRDLFMLLYVKMLMLYNIVLIYFDIISLSAVIEEPCGAVGPLSELSIEL